MKCVLTVIGKDKPGIIYKVSELLAKNRINIEDITQTIMQSTFTMVMIVNLEKSTISFKGNRRQNSPSERGHFRRDIQGVK